MTGIAQIDISVAINFGLSICIATLSVWGYRRIKKVTPLYFGFAYALFAVSHYLLLTGGTTTPGLEFFLLRTGGYAFVMIGLFALLKDIIERQETEAELRSKKARLDATFDQAAVGIAELLPDLQIVQANRRFSSILGYGDRNAVGLYLPDLVAAQDREGACHAIAGVLTGELPGYTGEAECLRKDGSPVWTGIFVSPVKEGGNKPGFCILVLEDISAQKAAEARLALANDHLEERVSERTAELAKANEALVAEVCQRSVAEERLRLSLHEKEVLIKEIHHRVKNNLQIIISLLYLQSRKTPDPACCAALLDSQTRIRSMALIHENLYRCGDLSSVDFDRYLQNLAGNLKVAYGADKEGIIVTTDARDLHVSINTAIPLGLVANELISNALKYAFTGRDGGRITLSGQKESGRITLVVRDNGNGIPEGFDWEHAETLGFSLIIMLVRQLKGTVTLDRSNGTTFTITIPHGE